MKTKGLILVFLSTLMFGSYGTWSRLIGDSLGIFYPSWTRALLIVLVLFPILLAGKHVKPIQKKDWKWMSVFLVATSLTQAPLFYAFNHMDIGTATLLFFVTMLLTMYAVGFLFLEERVTKLKIAAFLLACVGLAITFKISLLAFTLFAALMAVVNGIASGSEVGFSKKLTENYSALYITWLSWVVIAISNGIISVAIGEHQVLPALNMFWLYQVCYAIAGILGFWFIIEGIKHIEASIGGLLGLLEIVFSIVLGIIVFHEGLSTKTIFGGVFIVCAAALPHVVDFYKKHKSLTPV